MDHNNSTMIVNSLLILRTKQTTPEAYTSLRKKGKNKTKRWFSYGIQRGLKITNTYMYIKKNGDTKFCIYTHLVNSKFTTWQKPKVFLFRTAVNNLQSLLIVTKRIPLYVQTFLKNRHDNWWIPTIGYKYMYTNIQLKNTMKQLE